MANIANHTFVLAPTTDRYLTLAGEEYCRTLSVGTTWTRLRVAMQCAIVPDGTSNLTGIVGFFGLSSGTANPAGASSSTHAVGLGLQGGALRTSQTLTYNANAGNPYYSTAAASATIGKRVGSTITSATSFSVNPVYPTNTGTIQRRGIIFLDVTKGSPNFSFLIHYWSSSTHMSSDYSLAQFLNAVENPAATGIIVGAQTLSTPGAQTLAVDEATNGFLDSVDINWNRSAFALEVNAIAVYRFS